METAWNCLGICVAYAAGIMDCSSYAFYCVGVPICTVNEFGRVSDWNASAAQLFGISPEEAVGSEWHSVVHVDHSVQRCPLCQTRSSLRQRDFIYPVDVTLSVQNDRRPMVIVPLPMSDDVQTSISFMFLTRDVAVAMSSVNRALPIQNRVRQLSDGRMIDELTTRDREILTCVVNGLDARATSVYLGISHATARNYVQRVLNKLGVRNKAEAVRVALTYNLIDVNNTYLPSA